MTKKERNIANHIYYIQGEMYNLFYLETQEIKYITTTTTRKLNTDLRNYKEKVWGCTHGVKGIGCYFSFIKDSSFFFFFLFMLSLFLFRVYSFCFLNETQIVTP
uniref:Uncharacterized protein n=1 Tax=Cacopsylla melanoneura TaxID=428564 RepID=A0A8D8TSQ8_9HEMI